MHFWQYMFFFSCGIVFYNYAGYAVLAWLLTRLTGKYKPPPVVPDNLPSLSFVVAAYNEAGCIEQKIRNSFELDYPAGLLEFLFVTDGSTDETPAIIASFPAVHLLHAAPRSGKSSAVNRAIHEARNEVLVFSDANTLLNKDALLNIARHYSNPDTGGVAGEKKILSPATGNQTGPSDAGDGEGIYWRYESRLKQIDSDFYSVVGAAGELFSLRRDLYQPLPENTILDDFILSLRVAAKGFRIRYEPGAFAMELPSSSTKEEQKRKIRIAAGGFQSIGMLAPLLAFWRRPRLSFLYISHRVLRWTLSPLCLILALVSSLIVALQTANPLFVACAGAQVLFYGMAALYRLHLPGRSLNKILKIPYYFTFMNVSVLLGFIRFCKGGQSAVWERSKRMVYEKVVR